jgi:splicing factor 3B subunit 1
MDAVEGARVTLGPGVMLGYALQGLFHPARKVRETYWKVYNNLYIGAQDALVPAYPSLNDEEGNTYRRHELDVFL